MKKTSLTSPHSISTQSVFDQMFAMSIDANKDPIFLGQHQEIENKLFQIDSLDAILLLESNCITSNLPVDFQRQLTRCKEYIAESNTTGRPLSSEEAVCIHKFKEEAVKYLNGDICDDRSWRGRVPDILQLRGLVGGTALSAIEDEEVWMVRGADYLKDNEKVCRYDLCA